MLPDDPLKNVLYIDLSRKSFRVQPRAELFDKYLGGAGVAAQLLAEERPQGIDPLDPRNPIIFAVGPLTGLFSLASKTVAMFKSPLTGNLGESHAGGRSAVAIRMAGYGAIVIKGASDIPVYIAIHGERVYFRDATTLWGMGSSLSAGRVIRENEEAPGLRTIMRIGPAGEKLIPYAAVTTETYRHFGRLGLGAVFGSKKLKAVVVSGKRTLPVSSRRDYRALYDRIHQMATTSPVMKKYHDLGTPENILPLNTLGGLPTRNLQAGRLEGAENVSGEHFAEHYLGRRLACSHCPVGCIHIAALREPYLDEAYFYKTTMTGYDYELIYSLGAMLGLSDPEGILKLIDTVETVGLDAMSTGVILAWAAEAQEKGLISETETGGLHLQWGHYEGFQEALKRIVSQPNEFYQTLARGVRAASARYGGQEFAMAYGGNEMPGYHTGPAAHLGFLLGARHSHLDNAGYSIDQKILPKKKLTPAELVEMILAEERWRQVLSSLVICFFARGIYEPGIVRECLKIAGHDLSEEQLRAVGVETLKAKYAFKTREGFDLLKEPLPARIFQTPSPLGDLDEAYMRQAIEYAHHTLQK